MVDGVHHLDVYFQDGLEMGASLVQGILVIEQFGEGDHRIELDD